MQIRVKIDLRHVDDALQNISMEEKNMAYNITDACIKCGACADNCPVEAISEGEDKYVIDADVCVSCGACADNCPVEAIEEG